MLAVGGVGGDHLHGNERLDLLEGVPHPDLHLGQVAGGRPHPERDRGSRRHGAERRAVQVVARVVIQAVVVDLAIDREGRPVGTGGRRFAAR